jgi:UDP-N-acetylmuramate: L-alanyl-gamma-D-glutamyl-meso-diaminopimelate ligase
MIGIGGIAMGNLAFMLKSSGHTVSGSDQNLYPPMSLKLEEWKIETDIGFQPDKVIGKDLVIIGNAISRGNPQVEEVLNRGIDYLSMPQAISHFFLKNKKVIVVAGTHGKTTTTFLIHHILKEAGARPGLFVGGIRSDGSPGFELGDGEYFVIEGDEYDSAFFDKASKFLHYRPYYLVLTSLDFDHADIFSDLSAIKTMFKRLTILVPSNGKVFYWKGSESLNEILQTYTCSPKYAYEINEPSSFLSSKEGSLFSNTTQSFVRSSLIGEHNYRNTEVALQVCSEALKVSVEKLLPYIQTFPGVKRRQEVLYSDGNTIIMEDFAHHPVAVLETIKAVKQTYPQFIVFSLFEPRSATSHRNVFQESYANCFVGSEYTLMTEVFNINKVPENVRLNVKQLVSDIPRCSKSKALYCENSEDLLVKLKKILSEYQSQKILILLMSNGSFGGIYKHIVEWAKNR